MKILLLKLITGSAGMFRKGEILDVENQNAYALIAAGAAVATEPEIPEQDAAPEAAVIKTRRQKR